MQRLVRGTTVAYGPHFGVVWVCPFQGRDAALLFPLLVTRRRKLASDLELGLAELVAAGIELPQAFLRADAPQVHASADLCRVGELRGRTLCGFVRSVTLSVQHHAVESRFRDAARQNCENREPVPVKMTGE